MRTPLQRRAEPSFLCSVIYQSFLKVLPALLAEALKLLEDSRHDKGEKGGQIPWLPQQQTYLIKIVTWLALYRSYVEGEIKNYHQLQLERDKLALELLYIEGADQFELRGRLKVLGQEVCGYQDKIRQLEAAATINHNPVAAQLERLRQTFKKETSL